MQVAKYPAIAAVVIAALSLSAKPVGAEPYLAVESGLKCGTCHTNPSGGGKRTVFGMTYARSTLAARNLLVDENTTGWNSEVNQWLGVGGDYRGGFSTIDMPASPDRSDWMTSIATTYVELRAIPGLVTVYADQQLAPGDSMNREAYLLVTPAEGKYTIKAGQMFLPFGLRLQDDASFVRQRSGINFDTPDDGIEFGLELPKWSAQIAISDGTAGAGSAPGKDQTSLSMAYVLPRWRLGTSININNDPLGDRQMHALFAGFRTGPISWLAELDFIGDDLSGGGSVDQLASLIEGNWRIREGQNLKVSYEFLNPNDRIGDDEQERYSIVWEYSPIQLTQLRVGYRAYNGVPVLPTTNRRLLFLEAHVFF